jgi:hypothetical protein
MDDEIRIFDLVYGKEKGRNKEEMSSIRISPTGSNESSSVTALLKSEITLSHELRN